MVLLLTASVAYACIPWYGDGQITGVTDPNGGGGTPAASGVFTGSGDGGTMRYCDSGTTFPGYEFSNAAEADGGDVITVTVSEKTGTCEGKLTEGTYSVIVNNPTAGGTMPFQRVTVGGNPAWSMVNGTGCFTSPAPGGNKTLTTNFAVDANGDGIGTFTLPSMTTVNGASDASLLCVGKSGGPGIFVAIQIEALA